MKKWHALAVLAIAVFPVLTAGCGGRPVTSIEEFADFDRVDVQNAFDIDITQSASFSVSITTSENLKDYLMVSRTGKTLTLKLSPNHPFTDFVLMRKTLRARITMPAIRGLVLSGASHGTMAGFESSSDLDIGITGASSLKMDTVEAGNVVSEITGASRLTGKLTAQSMKIGISGASSVMLTGSADNVTTTGSGASRLNLTDFVHKTASFTLSGASEATVNVRDRLDCTLSGASRLFFLNNPKMGNIDVTGASTIKHKD